MRLSLRIGFGLKVSAGLAFAVVFLSFASAGGCGGNSGNWDAGGGGSGGGGNNGGGSGSNGGGSLGLDGAGGTAGSSSGGGGPSGTAIGTATASDCAGCSFPDSNAPPCASNAPPIRLLYPPDTVLVPPNLNVISVQWAPFGAPYTSFSVDFSNPPNTDWHIITKCSTQTTDMQTHPPAYSGGCEVTIDPLSWSKLANANRGTSPIQISVRGSTDGKCATPSMNQINVSIAEEDLLGTYFYWKSTVSSMGVGGQIWDKIFGDLNTPEADVTSAAIRNATCNGCHSLSRDGSRMVVYSDDDDSDDEYSDVGGSYLDMTPLPANPATEFMGGVTGVRQGGQPPGFSTLHPAASYYVTSNGYPCLPSGDAGGGGGVFGGTCGTSTPYASPVPSNGFSVWDGTNGAFVGGVTIGPSGERPTMPDWSVDGKTVVYVQPNAVAQWDMNGASNFLFGIRNDDDHIFGGSLYTVPYSGMGMFGTPTVFLQSNGENNYYPSYSPDNPMSYIIFNRAPLDMSAGSATGCTTGSSPTCPNDSFSNPAARLMLISATSPGGTSIDLAKANGSPASSPIPLSNSYPRWAPFVQRYHGGKLLWFTFSSTRDYGVRILNHKMGMYQCYPADAYQTPGGAHMMPFAPACQEPQLWMAPINLSEAQGNTDPSRVAFWIPYQDMTTHNHTAQWTWKPGPPRSSDGGICGCSALYGDCGAKNGGCGCCPGMGLTCDGNGQCIQPAH